MNDKNSLFHQGNIEKMGLCVKKVVLCVKFPCNSISLPKDLKNLYNSSNSLLFFYFPCYIIFWAKGVILPLCHSKSPLFKASCIRRLQLLSIILDHEF